MSQYDPTLSVLGITDNHIKVAFVRYEYRGNKVRRRQYHVIDAELTYRLTRCLLCGFEALHPNGFYTAHVRILNGVEIPTVIDLHKQRWRCHNCYHTVSAKTPLVQPNHTIKNFFIAHSSLAERTRVQTVTMDMNAAYQTIIHEVFPKAQVVIDRFHIIQLAARVLDQVRVQAPKQLDDKHSHPYKIMKTNWRFFHQTAPELNTNSSCLV